ncbi:MAG: hypothetical protein SPL78_11310 [Bacteroidales bacterium]|nr:hypothetical protein [Bacteroidales bacterium]
MAPPFAMRMAEDLAVLPAFIAEPGSLLITDSDADARWLERLNGLLALDVHAISRKELNHLTGYRIMPWGWCLDLRRRLVKWGADRQLLPTKDEIYHLRGLSHRRLTINIHLRLQELLRCQATSHSSGIVESIGNSPSKIEGAGGSMTATTAGNHTPQSLRDSSSILEEQLPCSGSEGSSPSGGIVESIGNSPSKIEGAGGSMTASIAGNHTPQSLRDSSSILEEQLPCSGSKCCSPSKIEGAGGSMIVSVAGNHLPLACPVPVELAVLEDVREFVESHDGCFIKTPWSSSGRGIYHATAGKWTPELEQWCNGALKRQGSVLCEVAFDKVMDLAVEFFACGGKTSVRGFSIFSTDSHSQYHSGIVASQDVLHQRVVELYPQFDVVVEALTRVLDEMVAPHYSGWLGVDMLLYSDAQSASSSHSSGAGESMTHQFPAGAMRLNPCVELNLRPTMGAVTSVLGDRVVAPGCIGSFCIEQRSSASEPWRSHDAPVIENGRLRGGTLCLTTPSDTALYRALLSIDN